MTFYPQTMLLLGYPKVIPYTKFEVWTLWDYSFLSYAADKQTDGLENPTHAVDNKENRN